MSREFTPAEGLPDDASVLSTLVEDVFRAQAILTAEEPQRLAALRAALLGGRQPRLFILCDEIERRLTGALPLTYADAVGLASSFVADEHGKAQLAHLLMGVEGAAGKRSGALWNVLDNVRRAVAGTEAL